MARSETVAPATDGVDASTTTPTPNPAAAEPIPTFALKWSPLVRRPSHLPAAYDTRVPPEAIYFIPSVESDADGTYVVEERCDWCKHLQQACTRRKYPGDRCARCVKRKKPCTVPAARFTTLPPPKIEKPVLWTCNRPKAPRSVSPTSTDDAPYVATEGSSSGAAVGTGQQRHGRPLRIKKPVYYGLRPAMWKEDVIDVPERVRARKNKVGEDATRSAEDVVVPVSKDSRIVKKSKPKKPPALSKAKAATEKAKLRKATAQVDPTVPRAMHTPAEQRVRAEKKAAVELTKQHLSKLIPRSKKVTATPSHPKASQTNPKTKGVGSASNDNTVWIPVTPGPTERLFFSPAPLPLPARPPKVWASSRAELCGVLPEFARHINNVVVADSETPVLFLEGDAWKEDAWDGREDLHISFVRDYVRPAAKQVGATYPASTPFSPLNTSVVSYSSYQPLSVTPNHSVHPVVDRPPVTTSFTMDPLSYPLSYSVPPSTSLSQVCSPTYRPSQSFEQFSSRTMDPVPHPTTITSTAPSANPSFLRWPETDNTGPFMYKFPEEPGANASASNIMFTEQTEPVPVPFPANERLPMEMQSDMPEDVPPEIEGLITSQKACMPVNVVACSGAAVLPFSLSDGCGCALLGFFFVKGVEVRHENVREQRDPHSPDDAPVYRQVGRVVWTFQLEWTPGGDDPEDPIPPDSQPWWATTPEAHPDSEAGAVMEVPYTLLPLYLHAPHCASAISPAEVPCTGWHCRQCGRLNVQRNLSFQRCAKCSSSNGLPPVGVDYVRDYHRTTPTALPSDRYTSAIVPSSEEGVGHTRVFTYKFNDHPNAVVRHVFTGNRAGMQDAPSALFHQLQTDLEIPIEPVKPGRNTSMYFSRSVGTRSAPQSQPTQWPADAPAVLSHARELILSRGSTRDAPMIELRAITVVAWRNKGSKAGCRFAAEDSPIAVLCLGADIELSLHVKVDALVVAPAESASAAPPAPSENHVEEVGEDVMELDGVAEGPHISEAHVQDEPEPTSVPTISVEATSATKGSTKTAVDDPLMVTLVHGDMLLVSGADFEYRLHRTGMSIVLFGYR